MNQLSEEEFNQLIKKMIKCPFCKNLDGDIFEIHFHHWVCLCRYCDAQGPIRETPQMAVESWNRREK